MPNDILAVDAGRDARCAGCDDSHEGSGRERALTAPNGAIFDAAEVDGQCMVGFFASTIGSVMNPPVGGRVPQNIDFDIPAPTGISPDLDAARYRNLAWVRRTGLAGDGAALDLRV